MGTAADLATSVCHSSSAAGPFEGLVAAGVLNGVPLTLLQQNTLCKVCLRFQMPQKGHGHGKNGAIVRKDWPQKLVEHVFPTLSLSHEEMQRLLSQMVEGKAKHKRNDASNPRSKDILRCWHSLAKEDTEEYKNLAEVPDDEIVLDLARDKRSRESG